METWRAIPGYEGSYEASSLGRVRSLDRRTGQKFAYGAYIKPSPDGVGYTSFALCAGNSKLRIKTHRAVCMAFHGEPVNGQCVRHLNGDRADNRAENLAWGSRAENEADKVAHGRRGARLTVEQVLEIRRRGAAGESPAALGREHGVSRQAAWRIVSGRGWRSL